MNIIVKNHRMIEYEKDVLNETQETIHKAGDIFEINVDMADSDTKREHTQGIDLTDWDKTPEEQCNIAMTAFEELLDAEAVTRAEALNVVVEPKFKTVETVFT